MREVAKKDSKLVSSKSCNFRPAPTKVIVQFAQSIALISAILMYYNTKRNKLQ